ncbi:aldo/keto reductase [Streptomyces chartreusis]|uniref:aldo/keto reductase n=1 Tax=Streptomyces chartreusis TaxID=1969 RepID=UPI0033B108DD
MVNVAPSTGRTRAAAPVAPAGSWLLGGELPVRRPGFGALRLCEDHWSPPRDPAGAVSLLRRAVDLGVDLVDTADCYGLGANEELVARALHPYPSGLVVATKVGQTQSRPGRWVPLGRPEYLRQQVELSLRRLRVDRIDLLQLHRVDPLVPFADQVGALAELRAEGKIGHLGLCKVDVARIEQACAITPVAAVQNPYNVAYREYEDTVDHCARRGIAFIAWGPLAQGALADTGGALREAAGACGATTSQVALAWLLRRSPACVPIPGTRSPRHLAANMRAARLTLPDEQFLRLSREAR